MKTNVPTKTGPLKKLFLTLINLEIFFVVIWVSIKILIVSTVFSAMSGLDPGYFLLEKYHEISVSGKKKIPQKVNYAVQSL